MKIQQKITIALVFILSFGSSFASSSKEGDAAKYLAEAGIIKSQVNISAYRLDQTITRKETMKIIAKLSGKKIDDVCMGIFEDIDKNGWGCKYIEFAYRENLIAKNTLFRPNDLITKTEAMKLILKAKGIEKTQVTDNWQKDYMMTAYNTGIIEEKYDDYNSNALRGWIFSTATSVVKKQIEEEKKKLELKKKYSDEAL